MAPGLVLLLQAKSLPMASTNQLPNLPAVGAGYNAARSGRNRSMPGDTAGDTPGDTPADAPVDTPVDTPVETAVVPSVTKGHRFLQENMHYFCSVFEIRFYEKLLLKFSKYGNIWQHYFSKGFYPYFCQFC